MEHEIWPVHEMAQAHEGDVKPFLIFKHFFLQDIAWVSSFYICYIVTFGPFYGVFGTLLLMYFVK